ncbi:MAG: siroheme synthase CysG [Gammaproteobacteria bacterium]
MSLFPVFLQLTGRTCLVVGGGAVALRKIQQLHKAGARIKVVAPQVSAPVEDLLTDTRHELIRRKFTAQDVDGCAAVIAATSEQAVNEAVSNAAMQHNIPVNVVDNPALCSFIMPSTVDRAPVQIAISTGGASPVLARLLRSRLETLIPSGFGRLAGLMGEFRAEVKKRFPDMDQRRRFWEKILQGPIAEMMFAGQEKAALQALETQLTDVGADVEKIGEVYLVGGGPGDPDLLTFRALRLMQQTDVVLYDRLVAPAVLELVRRDAERLYVGKTQDRHAVPQDQINQLLITLAQEGKRVCRLKGGDPFIFGRGGEEIEQLAEAGVPFQVVPGITAATGCAAYAGIPLTHRDHAQSCLFVTAHLKDGTLDFNWPALVQPQQTLAVYMGVSGIAVLTGQLIKHGMDTDTPAAIVQQGTTPQQQIWIGTVSNLSDIAADNDIKPPSMIIIGEVVKLHAKLAWYEGGE